MLYQVLFSDDNSIYKGGDSYKNTKWNDMPDKPIAQIAFTLPDGNILALRGYNAFNHFIEATQDVYGSNKFTLRYQYLMGKRGNRVISFRISLFETKDSKYKIGDITRREYEFGREYNNKPTKGWKKGVTKNG